MASKVKFYNGTKAKVDAKSIEEGALYVSTDTSELLADLGGKRLVVGKQYSAATQAAAGLMSAADKAKLDGIASGAQVNTVTGVKGNGETAYRTGNVNITAANIGLGNVNNTADSVKNVASAAKLTTARTIAIGGGATAAATSFDGTANITLSVTSLDATKLSGTVPLANLPAGALERVYVAADDAARLKLTTANVQNGDVVKVTSTGLIYFVSDETKLGTEAAFTQFTAGSATTVPWSGVTGKPSTFTPSDHTHYYAASSTIGGAATTAVSDNKNQNIAATYIKGLSVSGRTITYTKGDGTTGTITTQDTNTTYSNFKGATSSAAGAAGLVPAPATSNVSQYLRGDGTWATPTNTTYGVATSSANGLMSSTDKAKLDGIASGANNYTHPAYSPHASGLYKVTVDSTGHVSAVSAVTKADITGLGIPAQDTNITYNTMGAATASAAGTSGLVPAPGAGKNTSYLRGDGTWVVPTDTNYYISGFSWTAGSTAGPTASITRSGTSALSVAAIPTASATASGVVTTGAQTFAGTKTFNSTISGSVSGSSGSCTGNAATATAFSSARTVALTGNVTGSASGNGSSGWSIATTIANSSVTSAKLGTDVGTVAVSSTQPTDSHVLIWIKP